jgi:AcrR family transcriptional regulator
VASEPRHESDRGAVACPQPPSSRDKILDTAEPLFASRGFEGVGLREVARLVSMSKSALFHHFPAKLDLYDAVLARILGDIRVAVVERGKGRDDDNANALERLLSRIEDVVDSLAASPSRAPLLLRSVFEGGGFDPEHRSVADRELALIVAGIREIIEQGVAAGEIREVSVAHTMQSLIGMIVFHFASGDFGDEMLGRPVFSSQEIRRFKEHISSFIRNGLAVAEPR